MLDHLKTLLALRANLLATVVATTGETTLGATAKGYTREEGSFVDDGFVPGMEVVPTGFNGTDPDIVKSVSDFTLLTHGGHLPEATDTGRSLTVGMPTLRRFVNQALERQPDLWFLRETYIPGASFKFAGGPTGRVEHYPTYIVHIEAPQNKGVGALYTVVGAVMNAFPPMLALILDTGDIVRVSTDPAPYPSEPREGEAGKIVVQITIPLIARTSNPI